MAKPLWRLESRDLKGGDQVVLLSNPQLTDFCLGPERAADLLGPELPPNDYDTNLWELRFDEENGKPKGTPRRLTDWTGFLFWQSAIDCGRKSFRLS